MVLAHTHEINSLKAFSKYMFCFYRTDRKRGQKACSYTSWISWLSIRSQDLETQVQWVEQQDPLSIEHVYTIQSSTKEGTGSRLQWTKIQQLLCSLTHFWTNMPTSKFYHETKFHDPFHAMYAYELNLTNAGWNFWLIYQKLTRDPHWIFKIL